MFLVSQEQKNRRSTRRQVARATATDKNWLIIEVNVVVITGTNYGLKHCFTGNIYIYISLTEMYRLLIED